MKEIKLPELVLVVLVGPSGSGKSAFANKYFLPTEILSLEQCQAFVSDVEPQVSAIPAAVNILHSIAAERLKLGKLTVIDALNITKEERISLVQLAKHHYTSAVAIVIETSLQKSLDQADRGFEKDQIHQQYDDFTHYIPNIDEEGFKFVYSVDPQEEIKIIRQKLRSNKKEERGGFDIIGDIHGCFEELTELLSELGYKIQRLPDGHFDVQNPENRRVIFLGDLTDRGNDSVNVLRLVMDMVKARKAFCICGNHDEKLYKLLTGKNVKLTHGLDKTVAQLEKTSQEFKDEVQDFLNRLIDHYVLDDGKLVVAHGGIPEEMHGRASGAVIAHCLFGKTTGKLDEFGLPIRCNWAKDYKGAALVVYGHTPVPECQWVNHTINIDTGCAFGGKLSAFRYPEKEVVSVAAKQVYSQSLRPITFLE